MISMIDVVKTMKTFLYRKPALENYDKEQNIWVNFVESLKATLPVLKD